MSKLDEAIDLQFKDSGRWQSLPDWADYFINVGKQVATAPHSESRIVTAIIVPTRAFGAALVGLGMVLSDAAQRDEASESMHFETLFDLPADTPVIFRRRKGEVLKGNLLAPEERDGKLWVRVQVHSKAGGGTTYGIDEAHSLQVQPAGGRSWKLPKSQGGENTRVANEFVDRLLGETDPVQLGLRSKRVLAFVGRRNTLEYEIRKTPLAIHVNNQKRFEGQLPDVLRVDKFLTPNQQCHRSALVPLGGSPPSAEAVSDIEIGVVYDGAVAFLKWGALWRSQHQIVILDRTETHFDEAISAINARFSQNELRNGCVVPEGEAPPGGEILVFREAIL